MSYRWLSRALQGRWCSSAEEALLDALRAGQALSDSLQNRLIVLRSFAWMDVREGTGEAAEPDRLPPGLASPGARMGQGPSPQAHSRSLN